MIKSQVIIEFSDKKIPTIEMVGGADKKGRCQLGIGNISDKFKKSEKGFIEPSIKGKTYADMDVLFKFANVEELDALIETLEALKKIALAKISDEMKLDSRNELY